MIQTHIPGSLLKNLKNAVYNELRINIEQSKIHRTKSTFQIISGIYYVYKNVLEDIFANVINFKGEAPAPGEHVSGHLLNNVLP